MDVSDYVSIALAVLAVPTLFVAWRQWCEVVRRRHVDMYWRIFEAYNSEELQHSRDAFFEIEDELQLPPRSGLTPRMDRAELSDYSTRYWREFYEGDRYHQERDRLARARVRFYAQTGVLLKKRLVDRDLLFGLIGPPLDVDMRLLDVVIDANREGHDFPRMFEEVEYAYRVYERWKQRPKWWKRGPLTRHM
jgi:hypothetical protein